MPAAPTGFSLLEMSVEGLMKKRPANALKTVFPLPVRSTTKPRRGEIEFQVTTVVAGVLAGPKNSEFFGVKLCSGQPSR